MTGILGNVPNSLSLYLYAVVNSSRTSLLNTYNKFNGLIQALIDLLITP
jgi:hypothetical protein